MQGAASVLVCVLTLLGRAESSFPPIQFVDGVPAGVRANAEAFVRHGDDTIYLITSSGVFQAARQERCGSGWAMRKLGSVLVHEEWHVLHGSDEEGAYLAQLTALVMLDLGPGTSVYRGVRQAMAAERRRQQREREPDLSATAGP